MRSASAAKALWRVRAATTLTPGAVGNHHPDQPKEVVRKGLAIQPRGVCWEGLAWEYGITWAENETERRCQLLIGG